MLLDFKLFILILSYLFILIYTEFLLYNMKIKFYFIKIML